MTETEKSKLLLELLHTIKQNNLTVDMWRALNDEVTYKIIALQNKSDEQSASLRAIKKINKNKNEYIDSLCVDNDLKVC